MFTIYELQWAEVRSWGPGGPVITERWRLCDTIDDGHSSGIEYFDTA